MFFNILESSSGDMAMNIPQFPTNDQQIKTIALLGYTGVGKTSLITAAYSENIIYGKDAFTQRFFQRIEDEIRVSGQIPLTMGEASTLSFIEPLSRTEFTVQDFSGEHIKLERKEEQSYSDLIVRADNAHALICLISAPSFYRPGHIHEEVDAIQTFVNKLRGLGTRIPVAVILTKCDTVPRLYLNFPFIKSMCKLLSSLPFFRLSPDRGLELTRQRFPGVFAGLDFKGKGPRTVFIGMSMPRLANLRSWHWPVKLQWLVRWMRKFWINPKFIFQKNFQLQGPFNFCFQAFQLGILRSLIVSHHEDNDFCSNMLKQFGQEVIAADAYGKNFYFHEYFERVLEDTQSLISEMQEEIVALSNTAERLLSNERDLAQNLQIWLEQASQKICKFNKPWSEGAKKSLETLRYNTLCKIRDRLQEKINTTLEQSTEKTFYHLIDILKIRRDISLMEIWKNEQIVLPEVESFQKKLLEHLTNLTLSRSELPMALFQEDYHKYLEVITIDAPSELSMLQKTVEIGILLQSNLNQYQVGAEDWEQKILQPLDNFQDQWLQLGRHFNLSPECSFRRHIEKRVLATLEQQAGHFKSLAQILAWSTQIEQILYCEGSRAALQKVVVAARKQSDMLLKQTMEGLSVRAQKCWDTPQNFPARLAEWFQECKQRQEYLKLVAGNQGLEYLENLQKQILSQAKEYLDRIVKEALERGRNKLQQSMESRSAFNDLVEVLQIYREIEKQDILPQYGFALPAIGELEKVLFHHLIFITIMQSGLTNVLYDQDHARFVASVHGSTSFYLGALDKLVTSFNLINKGGKEMSSLPATEWENQILTPMRAFHHSFLELAGEFNLPKETVARNEIEPIVVRSLQDVANKVNLRLLRDWKNLLYPLLQIEKSRQVLNDLVIATENEIRKRLQADLEEFLLYCRDLAVACQNFQPLDVDQTWQRFAGSVHSLCYNIQKFPHAELTLDENIQKILETEGPDIFKKTLGDWTQQLEHNNLFNLHRCKSIANTVAQASNIFQRPEAFLGIGQYIEPKLQHFETVRAWLRRLVIAGSCLVALLICLIGFRCYLYMQKLKIATFARQNFDQHEEIARRWQKLLKYNWLVPSYREISEEITVHQQLDFLLKLEENISHKKVEDIISCQKKLEKIMGTNPANPVRIKTYELLLAVRSLNLMQRIAQQPQATELIKGEIDSLEKLDQKIRQELSIFQCLLFEELKQTYHDKYGDMPKK